MMYIAIASSHFRLVMESLKKVGRKWKSTKPAKVISKVELLGARLVIMYVYFIC